MRCEPRTWGWPGSDGLELSCSDWTISDHDITLELTSARRPATACPGYGSFWRGAKASAWLTSGGRRPGRQMLRAGNQELPWTGRGDCAIPCADVGRRKKSPRNDPETPTPSSPLPSQPAADRYREVCAARRGKGALSAPPSPSGLIQRSQSHDEKRSVDTVAYGVIVATAVVVPATPFGDFGVAVCGDGR